MLRVRRGSLYIVIAFGVKCKCCCVLRIGYYLLVGCVSIVLRCSLPFVQCLALAACAC